MHPLRKTLLRLAGSRSGLGIFHATIAIQQERMTLAFRENMSCYLWGQVTKLPTQIVSVPRSLRRFFGRYVTVASMGGRRRKGPPKRNRHAPPEAQW